MMLGPVRLELLFFVARPKSHYNAKGQLLKSAPEYPTKKPDLLKLARAVEDALTGIVYAGDEQIVTENLRKRYSDTPECVFIRVNRSE